MKFYFPFSKEKKLFPQQQHGWMITYQHDEMPRLIDFSNMRDRCESSSLGELRSAEFCSK
jgi:hypothetical protein